MSNNKYHDILQKIKYLLIELKENEYSDYFYEFLPINIIIDNFSNYLTFETINNRFGVNFYLYDEQIRYLNDIISSFSSLIPPFGFENYYRIELVDEKDMLDYEKIFYKKCQKMRINKTDNIISYTYEIGIDPEPINYYQLTIIENVLSHFVKALRKKISEICNNLKDSRRISIVFNKNKIENIIYDGFFFEDIPDPRKKRYNKEIYEEFKEQKTTDEICYVISRFLPISNDGIKPLLVFFIFEKSKKTITKYINDNVIHHADIFMGILYDLISDEGLPKEMKFDNRIFYYASYTTLSRLNVSLVLDTQEDYATEKFEDTISEISLMAQQDNLKMDELFNLIIEGVTLTTAKLTEGIEYAEQKDHFLDEYLPEDNLNKDNNLLDDELFSDDEYEDDTNEDTNQEDEDDILDDDQTQ